MSHRIIIESYQLNGKKFRPGDWIERLCSLSATFGPDQRVRYAKGLQPCVILGEKCLAIYSWVKETDPLAYEFVMSFAASNGLRIRGEGLVLNRVA